MAGNPWGETAEFMRLSIRRGDLTPAGLCVVRWSQRGPVERHPHAPPGMSVCPVCVRVVYRGMGRWWEPQGVDL